MKGKNKEQTNSTPASGSQLSFVDVTPLDHVKSCPRFTSILNRPDGDGVGIEEMNSLQMEIESLLVNVMQRTRLLKMETMKLDDWNGDKHESNKNSSILHKSLSTNTNHASTPNPAEKHNLKKMKTFPRKPSNLNASLFNKSEIVENLPIVRNDIPDQFWKTVEPYCSDLNEEDLKFLENQIEIHNKFSTLSKINSIGKHYSLKWAEEDLNQQMKDGSRLNENGLNTPTSHKRKASASLETVMSMGKEQKTSTTAPLIEQTIQKLNKTQSSNNTNESSYGPLTQRLISALIEENMMTPFDTEISNCIDNSTQCSQSPKSIAKRLTLNVNSSSSLEKKVRKNLIEQGFLDIDENDKDDASEDEKKLNLNEDKEDEISNEIRMVENELKVISKQCKQILSQLLVKAKHNMSRQELKKKISNVDSEIYDLHLKCKTLKETKKPLTKKDKEKAMKLIKERETLKNQLNSMFN